MQWSKLYRVGCHIPDVVRVCEDNAQQGGVRINGGREYDDRGDSEGFICNGAITRGRNDDHIREIAHYHQEVFPYIPAKRRSYQKDLQTLLMSSQFATDTISQMDWCSHATMHRDKLTALPADSSAHCCGGDGGLSMLSSQMCNASTDIPLLPHPLPTLSSNGKGSLISPFLFINSHAIIRSKMAKRPPVISPSVSSIYDMRGGSSADISPPEPAKLRSRAELSRNVSEVHLSVQADGGNMGVPVPPAELYTLTSSLMNETRRRMLLFDHTKHWVLYPTLCKAPQVGR